VLHCTTQLYGPGSKCLSDDAGFYRCGVDNNCAGVPVCQDSLFESCAGGVHEAINCEAAGYTCGTVADAGIIGCLTGDQVKTCDSEGATCTGDVASICDGFNISEFDCAAAGGTCVKDGANVRCARDGDKCSPLDPGLNVCDGDVIKLCVGGALTNFDCSSVNKKTCSPGTGPQSSWCE
jgi:hypothetical protein